jgi:type IV pilus assembly protein PilW
MIQMHTHSICRARRSQSGFTLVELSIAVAIGLFLLGGVLAVVQGTRRTFISQNQLAGLQDNERFVMTVMTDVIQSAGYFPDPTNNTATGALLAAGSFAAGQSIVGTASATAPGDTISIRYLTAGGDNIIDCNGNISATAQTLTNKFSINNQGQLVCSVNGAADVALVDVNKVQNLQILYGVKTNFNVDDNSADTYMNATQVAATSNWNNVICVKVIVTFINPLYDSTHLEQPQYIPFTRVISVMGNAGVQS